MNFLKNLFNKLDPKIGKTVIHFTTHGCMATIHEFDYIGTIVGVEYPRYCDGLKFYKVEVLKCPSGEKRDKNIPEDKQFQLVASWYLQDLGGDFFIAYD